MYRVSVILALSILCIMHPVVVCVSQNFHLKVLGKKQELPEGDLLKIVQDVSGFILIQTSEGISRYNGERFQMFTSPFYQQLNLYQGRERQLFGWNDKGVYALTVSADSIHYRLVFACERPKTIFQAADHTLWVVLHSGIILHEQKGHISQYTTSEPLVQYYFLENQSYGLLLVSEHGHIFRLDSQKQRFYRFFSAPSLLQVHDALLDDHQNVWMASNEGLLHMTLRDTTQKARFINTSIKPVRCLLLSTDNKLYVSSDTQGLYQVLDWQTNPYMEEMRIFNNPQNREKIPINYYRQLFQSEDHSIWLLNRRKLGLFYPTFFEVPFRSLPYMSAYSMCQTPNNDYYFLSSTDFSQIRKRNQQIQSTRHLIPYAFEIESSGYNFWITTTTGKVYWLDSTLTIKRKLDLSHRGGSIFYAMVDSHKQLWFCQTFSTTPVLGISRTDSTMKLTHYGPEKGLTNRILVAREAPDHTLYLGGMGGRTYLYMYNPHTDSFINLSVPLPFDSQGFETHDIAIDSRKNIWMATSHGLLKYELNKQKISRISLGEFLTTREIRTVLLDQNDLLWVATESSGLFCYRDHAMVFYNNTNGLPSNIMTYRGLYQDRQGRLWVATNQGFCVSKSPLMVPAVTPQPILSSLRFNGKSISTFAITQETAVAPHTQVDVSVTSLIYPGNTIQYSHRLLGKSSIWSIPGNRNHIHFADLSPGDYILEITAQQNGYWPSRPFRLYFHVNEVWYKRPWAYAVFLITAIGTVVGAIRLNSWRLEKEKKYLARLIKEKTEELTLKNNELQEKQLQLATMNNNMLLQNEELQRQTEQLANQRDYIELKNNEILQQKDELSAINENLDALVKERTKKIAELNQQLIEYAFFNSHKVRGPLARILGIIQLFEMEKKESIYPEKTEFYCEQIKNSALELDSLIHEINQILSDENHQATFLNKLKKVKKETQ